MFKNPNVLMQLAHQNASALRLPWVKHVLTGLLLIFVFAALSMYLTIIVLNPRHNLFGWGDLLLRPVLATIFFVLGWQINKKYSGHTMSFLFLLMAYLTMVSIIASGLILLHFEETWQFSPSFYSALETVYETAWQPVVSVPVFLMPLFYPTGKLLSRYWRGAVVLYLLILTYVLMAIVFVPWPNQFNGATRIRPINGVAAVEPFFVSLLEIAGALSSSCFPLW